MMGSVPLKRMGIQASFWADIFQSHAGFVDGHIVKRSQFVKHHCGRERLDNCAGRRNIIEGVIFGDHARQPSVQI